MQTVRIFELVARKVLVARATARGIAPAIREALEKSGDGIELDFSGVEAVTPSFVDEMLGVIQSIVDERGIGLERIIVSNPPTRLSSKFEAIGRGRNLNVAADGGTWVITPGATEDRSAS